jgi:hypothetical protein
MQTPILGQSYVARSVNASDNRMVNLFPEATIQTGKTLGFLNRAPGLRKLATIGTGPIRGLWAPEPNGTYAYVVSGSEFYQIDSSYNAVLRGTVAGTGPVSIADNGNQIFIATNPNGYIYNMNTLAFAQITDPDFAGAVTVGFLDGYFVFNQPNSQTVWVTSLYDGQSIDPLGFASAEGSPDKLLALIVDHREAWLFGSNSVEVWYDAGTATFPLVRIQGAYNEIGLAAVYSIAKLDNGVFWLGADARGRGIVYRTNGYTGARISTHAVEYAIQNYSTVTDAIGYTYQQEGHAFYVLTFPTAQATWVYDVSTDNWHERAGWDNGLFTRQRPNCQMNYNNQIILGDYKDGRIYAYDLSVYADDTNIQKWLRSWRALPVNGNDLKRTAQHSLQLDCETGVGLNSGQGSDPQVMLRWSDDGGHTWSNEHWASMGAIGTYETRTFWRRLGMTNKLRDRVYEISGTDPVKVTIMGANLILSSSNA